MSNKATKAFKIGCVAFLAVAMTWIFTRPYLAEPWNPYTAYDEGWKLGYGSYPETCNSILCKAHHRGFFGEIFGFGTPTRDAERLAAKKEQARELEDGNAKLRAYRDQLIKEIRELEKK